MKNFELHVAKLSRFKNQAKYKHLICLISSCYTYMYLQISLLILFTTVHNHSELFSQFPFRKLQNEQTHAHAQNFQLHSKRN